MLSFDEFLEEEERWGKAAAGFVIYCERTQCFLWNKRSKFVNEPRTWSLTIGGKIEVGENALEGAKREFSEETFFRGKLEVDPKPILVFREPNFTYTTFMAFVENHFAIPAFSNKKNSGQSEIEDFYWGTLDDKPSPLHFSVSKSLLSAISNKVLMA